MHSPANFKEYKTKSKIRDLKNAKLTAELENLYELKKLSPSSTFETLDELISGMRKVESDLRRWRDGRNSRVYPNPLFE